MKRKKIKICWGPMAPPCHHKHPPLNKMTCLLST